MTSTQLNEKLVLACNKAVPDLDEIKELIIAGADTNLVNEYGDNVFNDIFLEVLYDIQDDAKKLPKTVEKIKEIISLMVDNGWDIKKFGLETMNQFLFSTYDPFTFELYRFMLQYDLTNNVQEYEKTLNRIGSEESYQRCCVHNTELENLFYAIYEMVEAKMKGGDYKSIEPYYGAEGLTIEKIVYFSETNTLVTKKDFTEYNADIGFVCGNKLLVLRDEVNILFMNDRILESPQIDILDAFGKDVIGRKIASVSFENKMVTRKSTEYAQQTIIITLTNGKKLKFTHNFGELPDNKRQSRFWVE